MNYFNSIDGRKVVNPNLLKVVPPTQVKDLNESNWTQIFTELGFSFRKQKGPAKMYYHKSDNTLMVVHWIATRDGSYNIIVVREHTTQQKKRCVGSCDDNLVITLNNLMNDIRDMY